MIQKESVESRPSITIVLGMHRSGTSAVANFVASLGFDAGDNLMAADEDNQKGYWEDSEIYNLNNEILNFLFLTWNQYEDFEYRRIEIFVDILKELFTQKAEDIIIKKLEKSPKIVVKDPRFSVLMPFWNFVLNRIDADKYFILCLRNPISVSNSIYKRNKIEVREVLKLWYYYNIAALNDINDRIYILRFENFSKDIDCELQKLTKFLGISDEEMRMPLSAITESLIDKKLIHHHYSDEDIALATQTIPEVNNLYKLLNNISTKNEPVEYISDLFLKKYKNGNIIKNDFVADLPELTSTLFYENSKNRTRLNLIQVKHGTGNQLLSFNFENNHNIARVFNIYLCDQPCLLKINSINVVTLHNSFQVNLIEGNYIYNSSQLYVFNSNSPFIKFEIPAPENVTQINIRLSVEVDKSLIAGFLIPITRYHLESESKKYSTSIDNIQNELSNFKEKNNFSLNQHPAFHDLNNITLELKKSQLHEKSLKILLKRNYQRNKYLEKNLNYLDKLSEIQEDKIEELSKIKEKFGQVEKELSEEKDKSDYLWDLKNKNEEQYGLQVAKIYQQKMEIEGLTKQLADVKHSFSWRFTYPLRLFGLLALAILKPIWGINKDIGYGFELLKREGSRQFLYRAWWYIKGKRLNEDIYLANNKSELQNITNLSTNGFELMKFPVFSDPLVSIIIPVYNQWDYTYRCLNSILKNTSNVAYEIIIADDLSTDETKNIENFVDNIQVIRNKENLRFLLNCNNAAKLAKGKYIHFLNNDVVVHPNWLSSLVKLAEKDEKIGIVGSKLIYPDGKLQEAGGIIWSDASGWNYGRNGDPEKPEYNYVREVDYISGASILIINSLWKQLGGFDERFVPAYYEDTDMAFQVRKAGYKVIFQPLSVVTHFEGISNGTDVSSGLKKFQIQNNQKFLEKWKSVLKSENFKNSENVFLARDRSRGKKQLLVIDHYVPQYDKDAGSRSTFSYIKLFVKMGFNVKFIGDNYFQHEPYTTELQQLGIEVLYGNYYMNNISDWIKENGKYFDFVVLHRMHIAPKYLELIKRNSKAKLIYIGHDLQFMGSKRKYELTQDEKFLEESEKFKIIETNIFNSVDIIFPFSTIEAMIIEKMFPNKIIQPIPVYFYDNIPEQTFGFNDRRDLLFVGGFGHPPNIDGLLWFVYEIFPSIKKAVPEIKLYVVGSNPTIEILNLSSSSVIVTGYVDDDELKGFYQQCRLAVIPLRMGAGVKGKLLESFYYQIPAIITPVAAEGVEGIENYSTICNNSTDFIEATVNLYNNNKLWTQKKKELKSFIQNNFSEESACKILTEKLV